MTRPATPSSEPPADRFRPMVERQLAMLGQLAEVGLEIGIALERQAKGGASVVEGDLGMAYARVSRSVRQTVMLQARLIENLRERERAAADRKAARKANAARIIRDAIDDERANDRERVERLAREAAERLEHEDFADLDVRPFGFVVAAICKNLGLNADWLRLADDCARAEALLNAQAGSKPQQPDPGPSRVLWIDPDSPPGETRYYDPDERRDERRRLGDSS